ncbi:hypothetical protein [Actinomycetospora cinnamomea]|uniref:Uncharacterized protein n=1 Tax=Actinomycetospora cinnamomea TaxID=663609 RepID=A0A2U1F2T9_9PSEU|nr:hypothetical protein [Actinomycetospora cinnamomea]PVZ06340.1 hypothetical protein C8D89_11378 [Actinomycetospora cinnamomea]
MTEQADTAEVLRRLDELVALVRSVDTRLARLEQARSARQPLGEDPDVGRPRRLDLTEAMEDAARVGLVGRAGAT